jgi:hypothetical protein
MLNPGSGSGDDDVLAGLQVLGYKTGRGAPEPPTKNWCFEEYESFAKSRLPVNALPAFGHRLFLVVAANKALPQPAAMGASYINWHGRMSNDLHIVIADCAKPFEDLQSKVSGIARQIAEARTKLVNSMLETWP